MSRWLLNSAVVTAPGRYRYRLLDAAAARRWYHDATPPVSTIGYAETAAALGELLGAAIAVNRAMIAMAPGDEARPALARRLGVSRSGSVSV